MKGVEVNKLFLLFIYVENRVQIESPYGTCIVLKLCINDLQTDLLIYCVLRFRLEN